MNSPWACQVNTPLPPVVAEWNGGVDAVSAKGGRIRWEVASTLRSQKERAGGEKSKGRVSEGRDSG